MDKKLKRIENIVGHSDDPQFAKRLENLFEADAIEYIILRLVDTARRRLRVTTSKGRDCAIALPRNISLLDRSILFIDDTLAIILKIQERKWIRLRPKDQSAALELGYHCGNLHWKVEFDHPDLRVAIDSEESTYLARINNFLEDKRVYKIEE